MNNQFETLENVSYPGCALRCSQLGLCPGFAITPPVASGGPHTCLIYLCRALNGIITDVNYDLFVVCKYEFLCYGYHTIWAFIGYNL